MLLFDEPLSNLDAKLRADMRIELRELQHRLGITSLYVTHDLEEALAMSDRIVVMRDGLSSRSGPPDEIYNFPRTAFVADFVGSANLVRGKLREGLASGDTVAIDSGAGRIVYATAHGRKLSEDVCVSIRAVHIEISKEPRADQRNSWPTEIRRSVFLGDLTQIYVIWGDRELVVRQSGTQHWSEGQNVYITFDPRHCVLLEFA